jgi:hypothetical protein
LLKTDATKQTNKQTKKSTGEIKRNEEEFFVCFTGNG